MMELSPIPRRAVLLGAVAVAPVAALTSAAVAARSPSDNIAAFDPRVIELDDLITKLKAAISEELACEGEPGHAAAAALADNLESQLQETSDKIYATPARSLTDLVLRARLVEYWDNRSSAYLSDHDKSAAELLRAVFSMAGLQAHRSAAAVVSTIPALIEALGGRYHLADKCGISVEAVIKWERDDFIPPGWEHRFACHAQERGYRLAPDLFGAAWPCAEMTMEVSHV